MDSGLTCAERRGCGSAQAGGRDNLALATPDIEMDLRTDGSFVLPFRTRL